MLQFEIPDFSLILLAGGSWIHDVSFSPSGQSLAICTVSASNPQMVACIRTTLLPFTCCLWLNETTIVASGYNCAPYVFTYDQAAGKLSAPRCLDKQEQSDSNGNSNGTSANFSATLTAFRGMDTRAQAESKDLELKTLHQNTITSMVPHSIDANGEVTIFSTAGLDGQIVLWNWKTLEQSMAQMRI